MSKRRAVVLVIDRLGAGWLGPYGNTWLDTPNFNRLAAEGVVFETAIADSPDLAALSHSLWSGRHALAAQDSGAPFVLPPTVTASGERALLLTDDSTVANHSLASAFDEVRFAAPPGLRACATDIEQTGLFAFFAAAADLLRERNGPGLTWLHSRGMSGPWDAPLELRRQFADEDDPQPPELVTRPNQVLPAGFDPDELLGFVHAYAGQVTLADMCLGMLMAALDEHSQNEEALLIVLSPRGFPVGEHRRVGPCDEALYGELLHVPMIARLPGREAALSRVQRIVQPHHLAGLMTQTSFWDAADTVSVAYSIGPAQRAIRTPAWFMREHQPAGGVERELFAKPDDRWEANEVSSRCTDIVELLAAELERFCAAADKSRTAETPPLPEVLVDIWR